MSAGRDQDVVSPHPATLIGELDALREKAREQLDAMRETLEELEALRFRIEASHDVTLEKTDDQRAGSPGWSIT